MVTAMIRPPRGRDLAVPRLQAPGFALRLPPQHRQIAISGQFTCYKTGQVYLLLTAYRGVMGVCFMGGSPRGFNRSH